MSDHEIQATSLNMYFEISLWEHHLFVCSVNKYPELGNKAISLKTERIKSAWNPCKRSASQHVQSYYESCCWNIIVETYATLITE